jgi:type IV secretion system protein VirB4
MNPFKSLFLTQKEMRLSEVFPITHLNSPSIFESDDGHIGSVLKIKGVSFMTEDNARLNELQNALHQALLELESNFIVHVTVHRKKVEMSVDGRFQSVFANQLNQNYFNTFKSNNSYWNDIYLSLVLKKPFAGQSSLLSIKSYAYKKRKNLSKTNREKQIKHLTQKQEALTAKLSAFKPRLLGSKDTEKGYSEVLHFLSLFVNGGKGLKIEEKASYPTIARRNDKNRIDVLYPEGKVAPYLCQKQLFFGANIQFQGAARDDTRYGTILSIKRYPSHTASIIFDALYAIDSEFVATHSFEIVERESSLKAIDLKRGKLHSANDLGLSQIDDLSVLQDEVASDATVMGYYHHALLLLGATEASLNDALNKAIKAYSLAGFTAFKENIGLEASFFAQIPTNQHFIARSALLSAKNFADFTAFHNQPAGFIDGNHLGEAVTIVETPSKTPVYLNLHTLGSQDNPSKGHTLVIGGNGAGKTVLANFLISQLMRYQGRSFYLERDEASRIFVLANDGTYTVVKPSNAKNVYFNPFRLPDTQENRSFIKQWFCALLLKPDEIILDSELSETVSDCVDYAYDDLEADYRYLSVVAKCLPHNFKRHAELKRWLKGDEGRVDGEYAWIFDNDKDSLSLDKTINGFDVSFLMDSVSHHISTPVYMYLLHRMRESLDGRLTSIVIDEAWQVLGSPYWQKALAAWLPTIRKKNAHVIMMTQSPETIVDSSIHAEIMDNKATLILFPNPAAKAGIYMDELKLNESEFNAISTHSPISRLFLYKQEHESILCKLDLSPFLSELKVLSGTEKSNRLLDDVLNEVGHKPEIWLPQFLKRGDKC